MSDAMTPEERAREALRLAIRSNDREIERMQGEDLERVAMPLVDELRAAVRRAVVEEVRKGVDGLRIPLDEDDPSHSMGHWLAIDTVLALLDTLSAPTPGETE